MAGANLEWPNTDNGRKYNLKTNKKGEYFSLGIEPGKYKVTLTLDGKQLDQVAGFPVGMDESNLDFDLKKSQAEAAQQKGISPEQLKAMQEQQAKAAKETNTVKSLNEKLALPIRPYRAGTTKPPSPHLMRPRKPIQLATCSGPAWVMPISALAPSRPTRGEGEALGAPSPITEGDRLKKKTMAAGAEAR